MAQSSGIAIKTKGGNRYVRFTGLKPFLGGYHHQLSKKIFLNATAQTLPYLNRGSDPNVKFISSESQTIQISTREQQTIRDNQTQMTKRGLYVSTVNDKVLIPKRYKSADELYEEFIKKVILIQKYFRQYLAKKLVARLRSKRRGHFDWLALQEQLREEENRVRIENILRRKQNPRSKNDFTLLYNAVQNWKQNEIKNIEAHSDGPERKAALYLLMERESELLKTIHQHKLIVSEAIKHGIFMNQMRKMSTQMLWKGYKGNVHVYTEPILRAKHLQDLYHTLTLTYLSRNQQLDALATLRATVEGTDNSILTREILDLVDREADLLRRGLQIKYLKVLHERLLILFQRFICTPRYNSQVNKVLKDTKEQDPSGWFWCEACGNCFPPDKFAISCSSSHIKRCEQCLHQQNIAHSRSENTVYHDMLMLLQTEEQKQNAHQSAAFLMAEKDFRYLIDVIWSCKSAMSAHSDVNKLAMCRWDKKFEWSPWNCLLLTSEEARFHNNISSITETYDEEFIKKVNHHHLAAKKYFGHLQHVEERFVQTSPPTLPLEEPESPEKCKLKFLYDDD